MVMPMTTIVTPFIVRIAAITMSFILHAIVILQDTGGSGPVGIWCSSDLQMVWTFTSHEPAPNRAPENITRRVQDARQILSGGSMNASLFWMFP